MSKKVGRFGDFGGQYVPETVMNAVHELEQAYDFYKNDPQFQKELTDLYHNYAGNTYPGQRIVMMETTADGYKVALSDKTVLDFDKDGNFTKATK